jgi:hypothetical protein
MLAMLLGGFSVSNNGTENWSEKVGRMKGCLANASNVRL